MLSSSLIDVPLIVPFITADVKVLLVKVCSPARVVTVASILTVSVFPAPDVPIPVPPAMVKASESKSILRAPPASP